MKARKRRGRAKVDTPVDQLGRKETIEHYTAVQVEDLHAKMDLVIEHTNSIEERFSARLDDIHGKLAARVEQLEAIVRRHSAQLDQLKRITGGGNGMRRS